MANDNEDGSESGLSAGAIAAKTAISWFCKHILAEPLRELAGIATDTFRTWRLLNLARCVERVRDLTKHCEPERLRKVAPKLAVPLLEAAAMEDDEVLREHYAGLLASYADPDSTVEPTPAYAQVLAGMTALDLRVLKSLYKETQRPVSAPLGQPFIRGIAGTVTTDRDIARLHPSSTRRRIEASLLNLARLGCVFVSGKPFGSVDRRLNMQDAHPVFYAVTEFAEDFLLACDPELRDHGPGGVA